MSQFLHFDAHGLYPKWQQCYYKDYQNAYHLSGAGRNVLWAIIANIKTVVLVIKHINNAMINLGCQGGKWCGWVDEKLGVNLSDSNAMVPQLLHGWLIIQMRDDIKHFFYLLLTLNIHNNVTCDDLWWSLSILASLIVF